MIYNTETGKSNFAALHKEFRPVFLLIDWTGVACQAVKVDNAPAPAGEYYSLSGSTMLMKPQRRETNIDRLCRLNESSSRTSRGQVATRTKRCEKLCEESN